MGLIWVVEDDPQVCTLLARVLKDQGHSVETFRDGASLDIALQHHCPELIVLDIQLPDADGVEICRRLRREIQTQKTPIIAMTGSQDTEKRFDMISEGANDLLYKPFDSFELVLRVRNHLARSKAQPPTDVTPTRQPEQVHLDANSRSFAFGSKRGQLTRTEFALLKYLIDRPSAVVDGETLLVEALGYPRQLGDPNILRTHVHNLRAKIEVDPKDPQVLITLPGVGYSLKI